MKHTIKHIFISLEISKIMNINEEYQSYIIDNNKCCFYATIC